MRFLLPLLLLLSIDVLAQCKYDRNEIDAFEKVESVLTKKVRVFWPTLGGSTLYFSLGKIDTSFFILAVLYNLNDSYCIGDDYTLKVLADDGSVYEFINKYGTSCSEYSEKIYQGHFYYSASKDQIKELGSKKMSQIRLSTSEGYIDFDMNKGNSAKQNGINFFVEAAPCILN